MQGRFLKPDFLKKFAMGISTLFLIGFSGSIFAPEVEPARIEAARKAEAAFKQEQACMGSLLWFEARGEPLDAQRGVLDVALNRAQLSGKTVCEVVQAPGQFQWTKHHDPKVVDEERHALLHYVQPKSRKLAKSWRWFYSLPSPPKWAHNMTCRLIGKTHFCKEKH